MFKKRLTAALTVIVALSLGSNLWAGAIFLTGHDPDFHGIRGANQTGARNINQVAIDFITDATFNVFTAGGVNKFLFVESRIDVPTGHTEGVDGIVASGFTLGTDFEHHDASTLNGELDLLGTKYNGVVVASDFGGLLTQDELDILNSRSGDIIDFLNAGGGLYAMAESNGGAGLTPDGGQFGYLPFVVSSSPLNQFEVGNTVTPFGASLGLTDADVNGNASHNVFDGTFGLNIVDLDSDQRILSLAGRGRVGEGGVLPTPGTLALLGLGLGAVVSISRRRSGRRKTR